MSFDQFRKHMNNCKRDRDFWWRFNSCLCSWIQEAWCRTRTTLNSKSRRKIAVQNGRIGQEPNEEDWIYADTPAEDILPTLGNGHRTFSFSIQSLSSEQRPGVPYDFRHYILVHKTTAPTWRSFTKDFYLKGFGRDVHLVSIEFMFLQPQTFRDTGSKFLLFNMNNENT